MSRRTPCPSLVVLALVAATLAGCADRAAPILFPTPLPRPRPIVVFVPGFTGTVLRDPQTGRVAWGDGPAALRPHDGGVRTAVPLDPARDTRPPLVLGGAVVEMHLLGVRKAAYGSLFRTMEANGWIVANGARSPPGADFIFFACDWRRDVVNLAADLARRLETLREDAGGGPLRVTLIGQSQGAQVVRWLLKYGAATLHEAEAGIRKPPTGVSVERAIFLGSSAGGSLRTLRFFDEGRRYVPVIGRRFLPEVIFTYVSLYEDLPVYRRDLFVDEGGRPLDVDVFDPAAWRRFGWSIYRPEAEKRLHELGDDPIFGDPALRDSFLARQLSDARRFHRLLGDFVPGFGPVRLYAIEGEGYPTLGRATLAEHQGRWRLRFPKGTIGRSGVVDGDGHAPPESSLALSPQELEALAAPPLFVRAKHFDLLLSADAQRALLEILASPAPPPR